MNKRDERCDKDGSGIINRRNVVRMMGIGAALPLAGVASADAPVADFVDIIGTDPSEYPELNLSVSVNTEAGRNGRLGIEDFSVYEEGEQQPTKISNNQLPCATA